MFYFFFFPSFKYRRTKMYKIYSSEAKILYLEITIILNAIKSSQAMLFPMTETGSVSETLDCCSILTRLVTRENVIAFSHYKSLKSYKIEIIVRKVVSDLCAVSY